MRDPRRNPYVKAGAQLSLVVVLIVVAFAITNLRDLRNRDAATTEAIAGIVADTCGAASVQELRQGGLLAECRLARAGELPAAIPDEALPTPGATNNPPPADVIPDNAFTGVTDALVAAAVQEYYPAAWCRSWATANPTGQVVQDPDVTYDAMSQTITLTCDTVGFP